MPLTEAHLNDPVQQHAHRDFARLQVGQTVGEALAAMRANPPPGRVIYLYAVDAEGKLVGVVPTRRLLLSSLDQPIDAIMVRRPIAIPADATVADACEFFMLHRLLAFPVVDDQKRMIGVVDVEMYTDELSEISGQRYDDLFQLIGVHLVEARQLSPLRSFRSRFPWLLCNIAGGLMAAFLSGLFEEELEKVVALALFIPVVLALAESVSIQSVSLSLAVLRGRPPTWGTLLPKLRFELLTGLLLGAASGLLVGTAAWLWLGSPRLTLCVLGGIAGGVAAAAMLGLAMPNILRLLRFEPQVAAGPLALASADMVTLLCYFNLARWLV